LNSWLLEFLNSSLRPSPGIKSSLAGSTFV
jgi:hypothetical protein